MLQVNQSLKYAISEKSIMAMLNHPFVISLFGAFQTPHYLYFVLEYCPGVDLGLHLAKRKH